MNDLVRKTRRLFLVGALALVAGPLTRTPYAASHEPLGPSSRKTPVAISEIMYKPAPRTDGRNLEFIELYNSNPYFHDIGGYKIIADKMSFTFPAGTILPASGFFVIAASPADVMNVYGLTANVFGPYTGSLKKSGTVQLFDEVGSVLLTVPYSNLAPWPVAADGTGHSLVLANPTYGEADPRAWDVSEIPGGSPGGAEPLPNDALRNVGINEVLAPAPTSDVPGFIELYNHSPQPNDISGCILSDNAATNKFLIPPGTVLPPGGFISFSDAQLGFTPNFTGAVLYFLSPDAQRILDAIQYEPQTGGLSFGRFPDGASTFYPISSPTPAAANASIYIGEIVINELMYDPISGNDDDQFIELYNKGTETIMLADWKFISGVTFSFPPNTTIAPDGYLVIARSVTNLLAKYANLSAANTVGPFTGKLSHQGDRLALARPEHLITEIAGGAVTNTVYVVEDEVTYQAGGRWGEWSAGGGSSLELINPETNHRLAADWSDSDETQKSVWTNIEATGVLDNGANYEGSIQHAQIGLLDVGECLIDNVEILAANGGANLVRNPDFEGGLANWSFQGCFFRSSLESSGFQSSQSLHLRCSDRLWTGDNSCQAVLAANSLGAGQTATLRFKARWLHGWPEALLRLNGNWLEATGTMPIPPNLGTPGARNSRYVAKAGPAIYEVTHSPSVPAAGQTVLVKARVHDSDGVQSFSLNYRIDPSTNYIAIPMKDDGANGDDIAGDGIFSAAIPGQSALKIVAFYLSASNGSGDARFPSILDNDAPVRECVIMFGDGNAGGKFGVYHLWVTQTNVTRWRNLSDLSNEAHDCTFVNGNRIIYNAQGRFAGSPYHQNFDTPYGNLCHYKWIFPEDDQFLGETSFNKIHQPGNGAGDDTSIQREQLANLFLRALGAPWLNRRYVAVYVNGRRRGTLMEDAQTPDGNVVKERFPNDGNGYLYKMQPWFEFAATPSGQSIGFNNNSWCTLMPYTTSGGAKKTARYRYNYLVRRTPDSASNFAPVFALVDAANSYGSSTYVASMENVADMENWMRVFAANHAAGNWDSFGAQNAQNLYGYIGTKGIKYSLLMWDFNIVFGNSGSWSPGQNLFTVNGADPNMGNIYREPAFRRMYWRALQELVDGPLNVTNSGPLLDAKFAAFSASGVSVQNPSTIKSWLTSARSSIASQIAAENTSTFVVNPVNSTDKNTAQVTGTAPFSVKTIQLNDIEYPVTWTSVTGWRVVVPLEAGNNTLVVVGVDRHGNQVDGASNTVAATFSGTLPDAAGQIVFNEIMSNPVAPGADYIELYNGADVAYDLSGWSLDGLSYTFPPGSFIASDGYLVLAGDRLSFAETYGASIPVFDTFSNHLPLTGATLELRTAVGTNQNLVAEVRYQNTPPWPASSPGSSLQLIDPTAADSRVAHWKIVTSNSVAPNPQWQYVTLTGKATKSILLIGLTTDGDAYVDDLKLVAGSVPEAGVNMITNGDFETALTGPWTVSPNMANSVISRDFRHSGNASLHVIATSGGPTIGQAVWQSTATLETNATYTLSYWYLPGAHSSSFLIRLSGSSPNAGHIYSLQPFQLPSAAASRYTPGAANSVRGSLPAFPALWINEVQPDAFSGLTNGLGGLSPWIELYNSGPAVIALSDLYLADDYSNLLQSPFPNGSFVAPGEFKIIFADGQASFSTSNELHTTFALQNASGSLALSRTYNGQPLVLDFLDYAEVLPGRSYGTVPDGQGFDRRELAHSTPGSPNSSNIIATSVVVNEWMASNTQTIRNPIGNKPDDWFELYNPGNEFVDLSGYFLSDVETNRYKFKVPVGYAIPPRGFLLVWADNQNSSAGNDLHVNFKLSKAGTSIGLFAPNGDTADFVSFGAQSSDVSQGRYPDGGTEIVAMKPTPGSANVNQGGTLNLISPGDQLVYPGQTLTVRLQTSGATSDETLAYSFDSPAPPGAMVDAGSGVFTWTPPGGQIPGTNTITIRVSDNGSPRQSAAVSFNVIRLNSPKVTGEFENGSMLRLTWQSFSGKVYRLQSSEDITAPEWVTLGSGWTGTGNKIEVNLDISAAPRRFYRLILIP